uniref:Uncharacterized protein n=1 Tax=Meloidogyne incognita TaxID=6306 RepID=A0A914M240_MELIC
MDHCARVVSPPKYGLDTESAILNRPYPQLRGDRFGASFGAFQKMGFINEKMRQASLKRKEKKEKRRQLARKALEAKIKKQRERKAALSDHCYFNQSSSVNAGPSLAQNIPKNKEVSTQTFSPQKSVATQSKMEGRRVATQTVPSHRSKGTQTYPALFRNEMSTQTIAHCCALLPLWVQKSSGWKTGSTSN